MLYIRFDVAGPTNPTKFNVLHSFWCSRAYESNDLCRLGKYLGYLDSSRRLPGHFRPLPGSRTKVWLDGVCLLGNKVGIKSQSNNPGKTREVAGHDPGRNYLSIWGNINRCWNIFANRARAGKWPEVAGKLLGNVQVCNLFTQATQIVGFVGPAISKRM